MGKIDIESIFNINEKKVLITGATGGIGSEICKLFSELGAIVIGISSSDCENMKNMSAHYKCDVSNYDEVASICYRILQEFCDIDVLINCAGITNDALTEKMTEDEFDNVISVNLKGTWNVTKAVVPNMRRKGEGTIINISSVVAKYGNVGQANYAASKAGIVGMSKSWAKEFTRKGEHIRVNVISPGYTETSMISTVPEELLKKFKTQTMLGKLAKPEDIAYAALFLASNMSSHITGTVLEVDGGMRL